MRLAPIHLAKRHFSGTKLSFPPLNGSAFADQAWKQAPAVPGRSPDLWRYDYLYNILFKGAYGATGRIGWSVIRLEVSNDDGTKSYTSQIVQTKIYTMLKETKEGMDQMGKYCLGPPATDEQMDIVEKHFCKESDSAN